MFKHLAPPMRWNAIATTLVAAILAVAVAVSPATADHGKSRGRNAHRGDHNRGDQRILYRDRGDRDDHGDRKIVYRDRDYRGDRYSYRYRDRDHWYPFRYSNWRGPVWEKRWARRQPIWASAPTRVYYYERRPYFFHSGFDVFFGGDGFFLQVGNFAPRGYVYYDPTCHLDFSTLSAYRLHLHHHHHPALIDVVVIDHPYYDEYHPVYVYDDCGYDYWDD